MCNRVQACVEKTGGTIVQTDTFSNVVFKESFKRIFMRDEENNLRMAFNGEMEVLLTPVTTHCARRHTRHHTRQHTNVARPVLQTSPTLANLTNAHEPLLSQDASRRLLC